MNATWIDDLVLRRAEHLVRSPASLTREGMRYEEIEGAALRVRTGGRGPHTIVFVPDPPNVIEHYDRLFDLLAPHVRIVCLELPGFGLSFPRGGFDPSFANGVGTVARLLDHLRTGPCVLALSCAAGLLSLALARERPDLVSKLILVQTPSWPEEIAWTRRVDSSNLLGRPIIGQLIMALGKRRVARGWYAAATPNRETAARFDAVAQERFDHGAGYCLASAFQALRREPVPDFGVLPQEALILWGMADRTHRRTDKRSPMGCLPGARVIELEGVGHFPDLERPEWFRDRVLNSLH